MVASREERAGPEVEHHRGVVGRTATSAGGEPVERGAVHGPQQVRHVGVGEVGALFVLDGLIEYRAGDETGMHVPQEGEGLSMADEIARWNDVGPRYGLEVVGPPIPVG